jgi:hypothetical protein
MQAPVSGATAARAQGRQARPSGPRDRHGLPLSYVIWLVVSAVALAGGLVIRQGHQDKPRSFEVPIRNLPAFHIIGARDVRPLRQLPGRVPRDALTAASSVIGRVVLTELNANKPIIGSELGPAVKGITGDLAVVGVPATATMALDGFLTAGDRLGVFVGSGRGQNPDVIAEVLSVRRTNSSERPYILIVSVPRRTPRTVIEGLSAGTAWIVREPGS